jgi:hypothetical protein
LVCDSRFSAEGKLEWQSRSYWLSDAEWRRVEPLIARSLQCALDEARAYFQGLGNLQDTDALTM